MDMPPNLSTAPRKDGAAAGGIPLPGPPENIGRSIVGRRNEAVHLGRTSLGGIARRIALPAIGGRRTK
nr:MAG TPA: hypothetical protein [Caudoviricetes sp.]